jgi:D-amino-acid dehydrogenase
MHVLIMGAGVAGVTAAWQLLEDGHEVSVVDRRAEAASETSFANAGLIAPGHAFAWASPKAAKILIKSLLSEDQPLRFKFRAEPALWRWSLQFLAQCTSERARRNTRIKHRLCRYAQQALQDLADRTGIAYDRERRGVLYLHRSQASLDRGIANMQILREAGQELEVVDRDRAVALDPALAPSRDKIAGGIYSPGDESGDACTFTRALAALCAWRGARFHYRTTIKGIEAGGDRIERVLTDQGELRADLYLLACGSYSPLLTRPLGERLSVYPIKGYSVTFPVDGANNPPTIGGVDEDNLCAYARLGDRGRRVRGLRHRPFPGRLPQHAPGARGPVPGRRRLPPAAVLGVPQADDARGHPGARPRQVRKPLLRHRPRPHGLDHGLRHGADHRRSDRRPHARPAARGFDAALGRRR